MTRQTITTVTLDPIKEHDLVEQYEKNSKWKKTDSSYFKVSFESKSPLYIGAGFYDAPDPDNLWIPANDRSPDKNGPYLVAYPHGDGTYNYVILRYQVEDSVFQKKGWYNQNMALNKYIDWAAGMVAWREPPEYRI